MADLQDVLQSIHDLSVSDQLTILNVLKSETARRPSMVGADGANPMIGLLADDPELADAILQSAMSARETRPLRVNGE
ncbi:MAG TPA: hypothetical protein VEQ85_06380 [Lacipirellulaceae bacterium]|nr:hypothetical protein [Lacipirellulaceae bacterium]